MRSVLLLCALLGAANAGVSADDLSSFTAALAQRNCAAADRILQGSLRAPLLRGVRSEAGTCSPKDEEAALGHYRVSALAGDNDARYSFFVLVGRRGAKNELVSPALWHEAWAFLEQAANAKHPSACRALADSYKHGFNVAQDEARAQHYAMCAK